MPVVLTLQSIRQEDGEFQASLGFMGRPRVRTKCPLKWKGGKEKEGGRAGLYLYPVSPTVLRETPGLLSLGKRPLYCLCLQRPLDFLP